MKIGLSTTMIQGGRSGVAQYVLSLVREFTQSERIELTLFVLEKELPLFQIFANKCRIVTVPDEAASAVRNILWHQLKLPDLARKLRLDLVHVPSYRRLIRAASCPLVGTIHDLAPFHVKGKYDLARMVYGKYVVKALARRQQELIAVSHYTASDIERFFGIPKSALNVIHNGIDHERFHPGDSDAARDWTAREFRLEKPFVLYVSRLEHPGKNHVRLIRAFEEFIESTGADWQLALGGGDWHGSEVIRAAAANSKVSSSIKLLGFVPDDYLPSLYLAAKVMMYPSLFEGFGLPPVEAMACGTPVISSTRGALKEVVADAALTIDPDSTSDMTAALITLAGDESVAQTLSEKGIDNSARFSWENTAREVEGVYSKTLLHA